VACFVEKVLGWGRVYAYPFIQTHGGVLLSVWLLLRTCIHTISLPSACPGVDEEEAEEAEDAVIEDRRQAATEERAAAAAAGGEAAAAREAAAAGEGGG
jgi:hypothetical protein